MHFGMTGALNFVSKSGPEPPFTRVRLDFVDDGILAYTNKRMIGHVGLTENIDDFIADEKLGPDALDPQFDLSAFRVAVLGSKRDIKSVLLDQQIIAGIGNIYSDETLFQARIDPAARVETLTPKQIKQLFLTVREVLNTAIAHGAGSELFIERVPKGALCPSARREVIAPAADPPEGVQSWRSHRLLLPAAPKLLAGRLAIVAPVLVAQDARARSRFLHGDGARCRELSLRSGLSTPQALRGRFP
jgi:ribosomal protein S13